MPENLTVIKSLNANKYFEEISSYENSKHKNNKSNKKGVVYTHPNIAKEMVSLLNPAMSQTLLEPSCGAGIFVLAVLEYITNKYNPSSREMQDYVENKLFFSDIDEDAVNFTASLITKLLLEQYDIVDVSLQLRCGDALVNSQKYDLIIGNPPYIRTMNLEPEYLSFLRTGFKSCEKGNIDIYYAFIELANQYAFRSCLIVPNSYLTNTSAKNLRYTIKKNVALIRDFKESKIFDAASTYTSILLLDQNGNQGEVQYAAYDNEFKIIDKTSLDTDTWQLDNLDLVEQYSQRVTQFSDIADVHSTIKTNADKAYMVDPDSLKNDFYSKEYKGIHYLIEKDICVLVKKLSKYFNKNAKQDQMIIFPYQQTNVIIDEDDLQMKYPFAYKYLLAIKEEVLAQRDKGKIEKYDAWYAYGRKEGFNIDFTNQTCFLIPNCFSESSFVYEKTVPKKRFLHTSGFVVIPKKGFEDLVEKIMKDEDYHKYLNTFSKSLPGKHENYNMLSAKLLKNYPYQDSYKFEYNYVNNIQTTYKYKKCYGSFNKKIINTQYKLIQKVYNCEIFFSGTGKIAA